MRRMDRKLVKKFLNRWRFKYQQMHQSDSEKCPIRDVTTSTLEVVPKCHLRFCV